MQDKSLFRTEAAFSIRGRSYLVLSGDITQGSVQVGDQIAQCLIAPSLEGRKIIALESVSLTSGGRRLGICVTYRAESELADFKELDWHGAFIKVLNRVDD
ncbi:MAG: hypothetical protein AB8C95_07625 [Phycisphaeraceae bacterium]